MGLFNRRKPPLKVSYVAKATDGGADQRFTLRNDTEAMLRPVLQFQPLGAVGPLPHVEVGTTLGIDRGTLVCPPGEEIVDILHFHGQGARQVRAVNPVVVAMHEEQLEGFTRVPEAVMVDMDKQQVLTTEEFWGVGLVNRNDIPISVGVTLVEFDIRRGDDPRQPIDAVTLEGTIDLASNSHEVLWLPEDVRGRFHAAYAHLVHPWGTGDLPPEPELT